MLLASPLFLLSVVLFLGGGVFCDELIIHNANELIELSDNVSKGTSYSGTTVFLDSDLSFAGLNLEPIGTLSNYFNGIFDGQGYVISDLKMSSSSQVVGLFGYSTGLTIRNVIIASSCSVVSSFNFNYGNSYIGGLVGYYYEENGPCIIENIVSMCNVSFNGVISKSLYLGEIAGFLHSSTKYESTVKNCANYGTVTHSEESGDSYIGGIAGYSCGYSSSNRMYVYNCLNYGIITHSGTTSGSLYLGGIVGSTNLTAVENCVSGWKILSNKTGNTGSLVGQVGSGTIINYCYYSSDLSEYSEYGIGTPLSESNTLEFNRTSFELVRNASIGTYTGGSLIKAVNGYTDYHASRVYSRWLLNKENNFVAFTINERTNSIKVDSQIILLPSLASEGNKSFYGWFIDPECSELLQQTSASNLKSLYGLYDVLYNVSFDLNEGGTISFSSKKVVHMGKYGTLPGAERIGYTFLGWFTEDVYEEEVTSESIFNVSRDQTLFAHWAINNYTITFDFNNGTEIKCAFAFNETIEYPEVMVREGYSFNGWTPNPERMGAENITIRAQWNITKASEYVEIVFSTKELSEEDVKEIIERYVSGGEEFRIEKFEKGESGEIRVIINFVDTEAAREFIRNVNEHKRPDDFIRVARAAPEYKSFSLLIHPSILFFVTLFLINFQ